MTHLGERLRPTIRMRLTLLYTGLFLCAGIVLLGLTYLLLQNNLPRKVDPVDVNQVFTSGPADVPFTPPPGAPPAETTVRRVEGVLTKERENYQRETLNAPNDMR